MTSTAKAPLARHARRLVGGGMLAAVALLVTAIVTSPGEAQDERSPPAAVAAVAATQSAALTQTAAPPLPADAYPIRSVLTIDGPLKHGNFYWDESRAPAQGPLLITVDLTAQTLSVFRDGHEIGVAVILYGTPEKPTPLGAYPITQKSANHISNLYHVPMPYMMRLTDDGVAIHGSDVDYGYGTRGCIGVPKEFARMLFEQVKLGDKVIITDGQRLRLGDAISGV